MDIFNLVINFIFENWMVFIPCLLGIFEFVLLLIFKKRPEIVANDLTDKILYWVHEAEKKYPIGNGDIKRGLVLSYFENKLGSNYKYFEPYIINVIETILDCQSK